MKTRLVLLTTLLAVATAVVGQNRYRWRVVGNK